MVRVALRMVTWPVRVVFRVFAALAVAGALMVGVLFVGMPGDTVSEKYAAVKNEVLRDWRNVVTVATAFRDMAKTAGGADYGSAPTVPSGEVQARPANGRINPNSAGVVSSTKPSPDAAKAIPVDGRLSPAEAELVRLLNEERTKRGLRPLAVDIRLVISARNKAIDMLENNYYDHVSPSGVSFSEFIRDSIVEASKWDVGENIGVAVKVSDLHTGWMRSPRHRENMLNPAWTHVGIGTVPCNRRDLGDGPCGAVSTTKVNGKVVASSATLGIVGVQHFATEVESVAPGSGDTTPAGSTGASREASAQELPSAACLDSLAKIPPDQQAADGKPGWKCKGDKLVFE